MIGNKQTSVPTQDYIYIVENISKMKIEKEGNKADCCQNLKKKT
jgi:hypothetical protein